MSASAATTTAKVNCLESYILIWLNDNYNLSSSQHEMREELQDTINYQKTFDDPDTCQEFIREIKDEYLVIVSKENFAEKLVLMMKKWEQIRAVYIYCEDNESKPELSDFQENIILTSTDKLVERIKSDQRRRQRCEDPISFNCMHGNRFYSFWNGSNYSFMVFELLIDVIVRTEQTNEMNELIQLCRIEYDGNIVEERRINQFQETYTAETSIRWFTKDCFVYRLLNKALRLQNINVLLAFRFVIKDIYEQLAKLQQDQSVGNIKVYRGQILPSGDLRRIENSIGQLISFHSFISTSCDED